METVFRLEGAVADFLDLPDQLALATASKWLLGKHGLLVTRVALRAPHDVDCSPRKKARLASRARTPVSFLLSTGISSPASSPRSARATTPKSPRQLSVLRRVISFAAETVWGSSWSTSESEATQAQQQQREQEQKPPVARLLMRHPRMKLLRLYTQSTVAPTATALLSMPPVQSLHSLIVTKVSLEGLLDADLLADALPCLPGLQVLDMSHNCLLQQAGVALGRALGCSTCCPRLTELGLGGWGNRMGADGLVALAEGLGRRWGPSETRPAALAKLSLGADEEEAKAGTLDALWPALLPGLEELELWCTGVGRSVLDGVATGLGAVGGAPKLRVVRVRSRKEGGVSGVEAMLAGLLSRPANIEDQSGGQQRPASCPCLEVLELWQCAVVAEAVEALAAEWPPTLRELRLQKAGLRDNEVVALRLGNLANGPLTSALRVLDLTGNSEMCEEAGAALGQALQHGGCPGLQVLELAETRLGDGGTEALAKSLASAACGRVLRRVALGGTGLSERGVVALMAVGLTALEELELCGNPDMGDGGVKAVAVALQVGALEALRVLDLSDVGLVEGEAAEALAVALEGGAGRRLRMVRVSRNGEGAVRRVVQAAENRRSCVEAEEQQAQGAAPSRLQIIT